MMCCSHCGATGVDLVSGVCADCYYSQPPPQPSLYPTEADLCAGHGHTYYGDEWATTPESLEAAGDTAGRCYCGAERYPAGGPRPADDVPPHTLGDDDARREFEATLP